MEIALTADVAVAQGLVVGRLVKKSAIEAVLEDRTDRGDRASLDQDAASAGRIDARIVMPIDLQNYVNELQYLPLQFSQKGDDTAELHAMGIHAAIARNKKEPCYEPIALKTMQDGYVQIVR